MKLGILLFVFGVTFADKLQNNYLPPQSAKTAGGSGFLSAPSPGSSFTRSGIATSYAAPPSGPVTSGLYNAPAATRSFSGGSSYSGSYSSGQPIAILRLNNDNNGDGSYRFEYETENRISQQEEGHLENAGTDHESNVVHGSYSYQAPDGQTITVNYVADENGFRPVGDHIPTPPPIPAAIQKSLEINAAASRAPGYSSNDGYQSSFSGSQSVQASRQYLAPRGNAGGNSGYRY